MTSSRAFTFPCPVTTILAAFHIAASGDYIVVPDSSELPKHFPATVARIVGYGFKRKVRRKTMQPRGDQSDHCEMIELQG